MTRYISAALSLLLASSSSAKTIGTISVPRLTGTMPILISGALRWAEACGSHAFSVVVNSDVGRRRVSPRRPSLRSYLVMRSSTPRPIRCRRRSEHNPSALPRGATLSGACGRPKDVAQPSTPRSTGSKRPLIRRRSVPSAPSSDSFVRAQRRFAALRRTKPLSAVRPERSDRRRHAGRMERLPSTNPSA